MTKTFKHQQRQEKEKYKTPKSVQDAVPIKTIWEDGIFLVGKSKYAKTYKITDINYAVASREDKEKLFLDYSALLNSFDAGATTKITTALRRLNQKDFEKQILIPYREDGNDLYRREYNEMLLSKATGANSMVRELYITISVVRRNIEEAKGYFRRIGTDLISHASRLGSHLTELDAVEKLRILHDFYRTGNEANYNFDMKSSCMKGHSFKDYIVPDALEFKADHFVMGNRYGRVLFLREYASYIKDSMFTEFTELNRNIMLSIDVIPVPTDEAVREVEKRLLGVETNITNFTRKQNQNQNYNVEIPYDMAQQRKEAREFLDDLVTRDQRMMFVVVTLVHTAETLEQLDSDTEAIQTVANKHLCQLATAKFQQLDALNTALPIGVRNINALRTLTTESLAVLMPFRVQEIMDKGGNYFGENAISHNMILCNKSNLLNPNGFVLGVPGAGKSFITKQHIVDVALSTQDDIIICDPEGEVRQEAA
jgi:type IV secretory pathway VirB4 component